MTREKPFDVEEDIKKMNSDENKEWRELMLDLEL